jgi:hypothetical protein
MYFEIYLQNIRRINNILAYFSLAKDIVLEKLAVMDEISSASSTANGNNF